MQLTQALDHHRQLSLKHEEYPDCINLFIQSPGGSLLPTLALVDEIKNLGIPFGFKLNGFIKTNPKPNYTGAYKKSKTGNPNEFLGQRKDLTPEKKCYSSTS